MSVSVPPLPVTLIRDLPTTLSEEARDALNFFKMWYPDRARPRSAQVLLVSVSEGVRRTTSPRQVSTFPPGKYNFSTDPPIMSLSLHDCTASRRANFKLGKVCGLLSNLSGISPPLYITLVSFASWRCSLLFHLLSLAPD